MEQAAQLFTDYYEGEVSVKPSDLRAFTVTWNQAGDLVEGIVPRQFEESPFPVVLLKNSDNQLCSLEYSDTSPYPVSGISVYHRTGTNPESVNAFMQEQTLAKNGFLLIGWVDADNSLIGMQKHPKWDD